MGKTSSGAIDRYSSTLNILKKLRDLMICCFRMKMRVWKRMEVEPVFAHRGEMTLGLFSYSPASKVLSQRKQSIKTREP